MSPRIAWLTASTPSAACPAAITWAEVVGAVPQWWMSAPRALIDTGTPKCLPRAIAAGPSGKKNSASITSKAKSWRMSLSSGISRRTSADAWKRPPVPGSVVKRGRYVSSPFHVSRLGNVVRPAKCLWRESGHSGSPTGATTRRSTPGCAANPSVCRSTNTPKLGRVASGNSVESVRTRSMVGTLAVKR